MRCVFRAGTILPLVWRGSVLALEGLLGYTSEDGEGRIPNGSAWAQREKSDSLVSLELPSVLSGNEARKAGWCWAVEDLKQRLNGWGLHSQSREATRTPRHLQSHSGYSRTLVPQFLYNLNHNYY